MCSVSRATCRAANCWGGGWKALQEALRCGQEMTPYRISQGETFEKCYIHWFIWRGKWRRWLIVSWGFIYLTSTLYHAFFATGFSSRISLEGWVSLVQVEYYSYTPLCQLIVHFLSSCVILCSTLNQWVSTEVRCLQGRCWVSRVTGRNCQALPCAGENSVISVSNLRENTESSPTKCLLDKTTTWEWKPNVEMLCICRDSCSRCRRQWWTSDQWRSRKITTCKASVPIPNLKEKVILCATEHLLDTGTTQAWKSDVNTLHGCWDTRARCWRRWQEASEMTCGCCWTTRCAWEAFPSGWERTMTNPCHAGALNFSKYHTLFNNYSLRGEMPQMPHFRHTSTQ